MKVAFIETDQSTVPLLFLYLVIFVLVIVFEVEKSDTPDGIVGASRMVVSR